MSSVNPHYTFEYSQPDDYRFSHDSVFMARKMFEILKGTPLTDWHVLDLCAGCGIIGLDFLFHLQKDGLKLPASCDFLDVQEDYLPHFEKNAKAVPGCKLRFLNRNYSSLIESTKHYDLILCNPPYFREGQGDLSPSDFKNRCRFFIDSDFPTLLNAVLHSMNPVSGRAFLLLRDLSDHGINVEQEAHEILASACKVEKAGEIRGTALMKLFF